MKLKRSILAPLVVAGLSLGTGGWFLQRGVNQEQNVYVQAKLFEEVLGHVENRFVDQKQPSELYRMAIDGMLEELGDPHTAFMSAKEYAALRVQTQGEYGGLGIQIGKRDGWITVIAPLPGTPAERAGMQTGDQIIEIDGKSAQTLSEDDAVGILRGPKGTAVNLKVMRPGMDQPLTFRIIRDEIHVRSVPSSYMVNDKVGYVELTVFSESSTEELRSAINQLRAQGMKALILDMRANPGGLLDQGATISDLFLERGDLIVETKGRVARENQRAVARDPDEFPNMPIAVLVGPGTASAAEIVAGALQDHDRALVVGRTTYGKGSVQQLFPLSNQNYLKMTTQRWYTPSGRTIQRPYGIDANGAASAMVPPDSASAPEDTTKKPEYHTDGGRVVYGGGGIHPDVVVLDTLTSGERLLVEALQTNFAKYMEQRFSFSLRYARENPNLKPGFEVTRPMLDAFYRQLQSAGVKIDRSVYDGGSRWLATGLGYEITQAKFGQQEARKRLNAESQDVRVAADLLQRSTTPASVFNVAKAYEAQRPTAKSPGTR